MEAVKVQANDGELRVGRPEEVPSGDEDEEDGGAAD